MWISPKFTESIQQLTQNFVWHILHSQLVCQVASISEPSIASDHVVRSIYYMCIWLTRAAHLDSRWYKLEMPFPIQYLSSVYTARHFPIWNGDVVHVRGGGLLWDDFCWSQILIGHCERLVTYLWQLTYAIRMSSGYTDKLWDVNNAITSYLWDAHCIITWSHSRQTALPSIHIMLILTYGHKEERSQWMEHHLLDQALQLLKWILERHVHNSP